MTTQNFELLKKSAVTQIAQDLANQTQAQLDQWDNDKSFTEIGDFTAGFTITARQQIALFNGEWYRWDGALPKVVAPGSTPIGTGGIAQGAWLSVGDAALRSALAAPDSTVLVGGVEAGFLAAYQKTIADLILVNDALILDGTQFNVTSYHAGVAGGGGVFYWDVNKLKSEHNGGTVIDPLAPFPVDFNNQTQLLAWFNASNTGSGCWVRQYKDAVYASEFGCNTSIADNKIPLTKAIKYAEQLGSAVLLPGTSQATANTVKVYVTGYLKTSGGIPLFSRLYLEGLGKAVIYSVNGNRVDTLFTSTNLWKLNVNNISFVNYDKVFNTSTSNIGGAAWTFENVIVQKITCFVDSQSYNQSRSTFVTFNNCEVSYDVDTLAKLYCDQVNFNDCWLLNSMQAPLIYGNSNFSLNNCILEPIDPGLGKCYVYLTDDNGEGGITIDSNRSVNIEGGRVSNEGGGCPLVVCDYGIASGTTPVIGPIIAISNVAMSGFKNSKFKADDTESGTVYLLKYPQAVFFSNCSFGDIGDVDSQLVAKSVSLTTEPHPWFNIHLDDTTAQIALESADGYSSSSTIAKSLANWINNPEPGLFAGLREFGYVPVAASSTIGVRKGTLKLKTGWSGASPATIPNVFILVLSGSSQVEFPSDLYAGSAVYIVSIQGFNLGSARHKLSFTKLHSDTFGLGNDKTAELVSLHFGTGDTGPTDAPLAGEHTVSFTFGNGMAAGQARVMPLNITSSVNKLKRFG